MKLSGYAKELGISYQTAWNHFKAGKIAGAYQLETGTVIVPNSATQTKASKVVVYCRVSSSMNKSNLESQADRLVAYSNAKGYQVNQVIKEVGSGLNDNRKKLQRILNDRSVGLIIVEHKDRLTRFSFNYIQTLLNLDDRHIEIVNEVDTDKQDLIQDFVSVITSFCARLYGQRRTKRKTEELIEQLEKEHL